MSAALEAADKSEEKELSENDEKEKKNPWTSINDMLCNNRCFICTQGFPRGKKKKVFMVSQILQSFTAIYATKDKLNEKHARDELNANDSSVEDGDEHNVVSSSTAMSSPATSSGRVGTDEEERGAEHTEPKAETEAPVDEWSLDNTSMDPRLLLLINFKEQCPHVWGCWQSFYSLAGSPALEQQLVDMLAEEDVQVWMSGLACCRSDMCAAMYRAITSDNTKNERIASVLASKEKFTHKNTFCPPDCDCDSPWQFMNM